jgi:RimJ/RimL family protein N-acetyltransferase
MAELVLREATPADADRLLEWRNDPATRAASGSTAAVIPDEHRAWLDQLLNDPDRHLWIAELDGRPAGQARFDRVRGYVYEISVSVDSELRGRRIGADLIAAGCELLFQRTNATVVVARVKTRNEASMRAFTAAGFHAVGEDGGFVRLTAARPDEWAPWRSSAIARR